MVYQILNGIFRFEDIISLGGVVNEETDYCDRKK